MSVNNVLIRNYVTWLEESNKSTNTIMTYKGHIKCFLEWYKQSFGREFSKMHKVNVNEYKSFLLNIKKLKPSTVKNKIHALHSFNSFLVKEGYQESVVIEKGDYVKIQTVIASPTTISKKEVDSFRQVLLEQEGIKFYAMATIMAYGGLRISEVLNLKISDINFQTNEMMVFGKGAKYRIVFMAGKVTEALKEYIKIRRASKCDYLFLSNYDKPFSRSRINQVFMKHSKIITPHTLRHFYCTHAITPVEEGGGGFSLIELANQAGHASVQTSLKYTHPSVKKLKEKASIL
jgi:integrase/recombinase XerD